MANESIPADTGFARAPTVELVGPMPGTGFAERHFLVSVRGRFVQVSELLYLLLEECTGADATPSRLARRLTDRTPWLVTPDNVRQLVASKLLPLGLVRETTSDRNPATETVASAAAGTRRHRSPLAIQLRARALGPRAIDVVARRLQVLFAPALLAVMLCSAAALHVWLYAVRGPMESVASVVANPMQFLGVITVTLAAAVVHEFGHAAALRYGGGRARSMGFGFFLVFPAFYTDTTDSYRLGRAGRVRTGLGGCYFHLIFAVALAAVYGLTGADWLLVAVLLIDIEVLRQFIPFLRLDGYWVLADLTGVPDPHTRMVAVCLERLHLPVPEATRAPPLRPRVERIFVIYLVLSALAIPTLFGVGIHQLPQVARIIALGLRASARNAVDAVNASEWAAATSAALQVALFGLQVLGIIVVAYVLVARPVLRTWRWSARQHPAVRRQLRAALVTASGGLLVVIGALWPWESLGAVFARSVDGLHRPAGLASLAAGAAVLVCATLMALGTPASRRLRAALGATLTALATICLTGWSVAGTQSRVADAVEASIRRTTGRDPTPAELRDTLELTQSLGVSVRPGVGMLTALAGAALAAAAAGVGCLASRAVLIAAAANAGSEERRTAP